MLSEAGIIFLIKLLKPYNIIVTSKMDLPIALKKILNPSLSLTLNSFSHLMIIIGNERKTVLNGHTRKQQPVEILLRSWIWLKDLFAVDTNCLIQQTNEPYMM